MSGLDSSQLAVQALENYYNAYIKMDINAITETSIDEQYETKEEYMSALTGFFQNDSAQILSYEIISQTNHGDGYVFTVHQLYKDGLLVEGKRYVQIIDGNWTVYLHKDHKLRIAKIIEVPE